MAYTNLETALALECLRAPLDPYPINNQERVLNEMRVKYRTYYLPYHPKEGAILLPTIFVDDFGHEISRFAVLVDARNNQLEVLVERINNNIYFTRGWSSLQSMYNLPAGVWLVLVYTGFGHFGLTVHDRLQREITPPTFLPPMKLVVHKADVPPHFVNNMPDSVDLLAYDHDPDFFHLEYEKTLTDNDVNNGSLVLPYEGFGQLAFDKKSTSVKLVDHCGNTWNCTLVFVSFPWKHFKVGGEWSRFIAARRLKVGTDITIGAQEIGNNETIYLTVDS